jgi:hypothetical protein
MLLDALGNIGDFMGGVAVIVTIGYLAVQVRQNTTALRAQSRQQIVQSYRDHHRYLLEDPTLDGVLILGIRSYPEIDRADRSRFSNVLLDLALHFQGALALYESGSLDDGTFRAYRDHFAAVLSTPGGAAYWAHSQNSFPDHVVASVRERLDAGDLPDLLADPLWAE